MPVKDPAIVHREVGFYTATGTKNFITPPAGKRIFGTFGKMEVKGPGCKVTVQGQSGEVVAQDTLVQPDDPDGKVQIEILPFRLDYDEKLQLVIEETP